MTTPQAPLDLSTPGRYHVVGVGGPGMSAIALTLAQMGHRVSGSDVRELAVLDRLRAAGVDVHIGHRADHVDGADAVTASTAIPAENLELVAARAAGTTVLRRAGMLASICAQAEAVAVVGTHGKTTTTSMLALILQAADPTTSFLVGGDLQDAGTGARWAGGRWLVVEADESDGTHLELPVHAAILTNVESDHLDHYGTFEAMVAGFDDFLGRVAGPKVVCIDDPLAARLAEAHGAVTYGTSAGARYRAVDIEATGGRWHFRVLRDGVALGEVELPLRGLHNVRNATGAIALADALGVPLSVAAPVLAGFGGVVRRFDVRGHHEGITLVDDYAHLPSEIAAVLEAAAASGDGWQRIVAVFQPNRYKRMATMSPDYRDAFVRADVAVIMDVYASGQTPIPGVTGKLVVDAVCAAHPGQRVVWMPDREDLVRWLAHELRPGDVCISMGCGDVEALPDEILEAWARDGVLPRARSGRRRRSSVVTAAVLDAVTAEAVDRAAAVLGSLAERNAPLGPLTTYRVGGPAALLVRVASPDDLGAVHRAVAASRLPVLVVGRGSNLLVADAGFAGIAVALGAFAEAIDLPDPASTDRAGGPRSEVIAGAAVRLPVLARRTVAAGLRGLEWAVGVPGSVGGGVRMNAGGHGSDIAASLLGVRVFDLRSGEHGEMPAAVLGLRFRGSELDDHEVVLSARFGLERGDRAASEAVLADIVRWRRERQPGGQNAGSVFVNPLPGQLAAAELIDGLGLRGLRIGTAEVSTKHANFIQSDDGGRSTDVHAVMAAVRARVLDATGIALRSEIRHVGFDEDPTDAVDARDAPDALDVTGSGS